jgi:hypothetical protein
MSANEIRAQSTASDEIRTKDAADWIYAGELTAQLGAHAACVVGQHIQRLSEARDFAAMDHWRTVFAKVAVLLFAQAEQPLH